MIKVKFSFVVNLNEESLEAGGLEDLSGNTVTALEAVRLMNDPSTQEHAELAKGLSVDFDGVVEDLTVELVPQLVDA